MSEHYNEDHPEEIHAGETPEELAGHDEAEAEAQARAAEAKQKKDKKLKVILFGGLGVVAVGFVGLKIMGGGAPAPKPSNPFPMPVESRVSPSPALPAMGPVAVMPVVALGAPGTVLLAAPSAIPLGSALPGSAPMGGTLPSVGIPPVATLTGMPGMPGMPGDPALPSVGLAAVPAVPVVPVAPVNALGIPVAPIVVLAEVPKPAAEGFARGFDELAKKIDDLKSMFSKFDEMNIGDRLAKLEGRVASLEGGKAGMKPAPASSSSVPAAKKHNRALRSAPQPIVPLGQGEDLLFARIAEPKQNVITMVDSYPKSVKEQPQNTRSYALHAVIPNRIWIKSQDGTSQTFENGEILPDGSKILKIDPDRGDVVTSKGVLKFDAR